MFAPREQIRPQDLAGARGQQEARGKSDRRRLERRGKARRPNRREQVLPPERPQGVCEHRRGYRNGEQPRIRMTCFGPDARQVHAAQEERQQPDRQKKDEDGTKSGRH
jgi:hypothetical protein